MKDGVKDFIVVIVIATAIISVAWGIETIYNKMEVPDRILNEVVLMAKNHKSDTELSQCTKYLFDKNMKVTWKTQKNYSTCINEIMRNRKEQELKNTIGVTQ